MSFKKGDRVTPRQIRQGCTIHQHGEVFTVLKVGNQNEGTILDDGSPSGESVNEDNWELAKEEKMTKKTNKTVNYHVLNNSVVLNYSGKTITIAADDSRYQAVLQCIRDGELEEIPGLVEVERAFENSGIDFKDGLLEIEGSPIPEELNNRIMNFKEEGLPFQPLLAFWDNLKKNPSFNARKMLFKFLENNGHPLTQDGCFIAYRGVTEDFKDVHTKTFNNKPGAICEMPRDQVDDNPNNTCSTGLHVACFDYAKTFGPKMVEVKVNPRDVVSVPVDYNGTKMRTCRFEVIQECAGLRDEVVYEKPKTTKHATRGPNGKFVKATA